MTERIFGIYKNMGGGGKNKRARRCLGGCVCVFYRKASPHSRACVCVCVRSVVVVVYFFFFVSVWPSGRQFYFSTFYFSHCCLFAFTIVRMGRGGGCCSFLLFCLKRLLVSSGLMCSLNCTLPPLDEGNANTLPSFLLSLSLSLSCLPLAPLFLPLLPVHFSSWSNPFSFACAITPAGFP